MAIDSPMNYYSSWWRLAMLTATLLVHFTFAALLSCGSNTTTTATTTITVSSSGNYTYQCAPASVVVLSGCKGGNPSNTVNVTFLMPFAQLRIATGMSACVIRLHFLFAYMETSTRGLPSTSTTEGAVVVSSLSLTTLALTVYPSCTINVTEMAFFSVSSSGVLPDGCSITVQGAIHLDSTASTRSRLAFIDISLASTRNRLFVQGTVGASIVIVSGDSSLTQQSKSFFMYVTGAPITLILTSIGVQISGPMATMVYLGDTSSSLTTCIVIVKSSAMALTDQAVLVESYRLSPLSVSVSTQSTVVLVNAAPLVLMFRHSAKPMISFSSSTISVISNRSGDNRSNSSNISPARRSAAVIVCFNASSTTSTSSSLSFSFSVSLTAVALTVSCVSSAWMSSLVSVMGATAKSSSLTIASSNITVDVDSIAGALLLTSELDANKVHVVIHRNSRIYVTERAWMFSAAVALLVSCQNISSTASSGGNTMSSFSIFDSAVIIDHPGPHPLSLGFMYLASLGACAQTTIQMHNTLLNSVNRTAYVAWCTRAEVSSSVLLVSNSTAMGFLAVMAPTSPPQAWTESSVLVLANCTGPSTWCVSSEVTTCRAFTPSTDIGVDLLSFNSTVVLDSVATPFQCTQFLLANAVVRLSPDTSVNFSSTTITSCAEPIVFAGGSLESSDLACTITVSACLPNRDGSLDVTLALQPNSSLSVARGSRSMWNLSLCHISTTISSPLNNDVVYDVTLPAVTVHAYVASFAVDFQSVNMTLSQHLCVWCQFLCSPLSSLSLNIGGNAFLHVSNRSQLMVLPEQNSPSCEYNGAVSSLDAEVTIAMEFNSGMWVVGSNAVALSTTSVTSIAINTTLDTFLSVSSSPFTVVSTSASSCDDETGSSFVCVVHNSASSPCNIIVTLDQSSMELAEVNASLIRMIGKDSFLSLPASILPVITVSGSSFTFSSSTWSTLPQLFTSSCYVITALITISDSTLTFGSLATEPSSRIPSLVLSHRIRLFANISSITLTMSRSVFQSVSSTSASPPSSSSVVLLSTPNVGASTLAVTVDNCSFSGLAALVATNLTAWNMNDQGPAVVFSGCTSTWNGLAFVAMDASLFAVEYLAGGVTSSLVSTVYGAYEAGTEADCPLIPGSIPCYTNPQTILAAGVYLVDCYGYDIVLELASCVVPHPINTRPTEGPLVELHIQAAMSLTIRNQSASSGGSSATSSAAGNMLCSLGIALNGNVVYGIAVSDVTLHWFNVSVEPDAAVSSDPLIVQSNVSILGGFVLDHSDAPLLDATSGSLVSFQNSTVAHVHFVGMNASFSTQAITHIISLDESTTCCNITMELSEYNVTTDYSGDEAYALFSILSSVPGPDAAMSHCRIAMSVHHSDISLSSFSSVVHVGNLSSRALVELLLTSQSFVLLSSAPLVHLTIGNASVPLIALTVSGSSMDSHGGPLISLTGLLPPPMAVIETLSVMLEDSTITMQPSSSAMHVIELDGLFLRTVTVVVSQMQLTTSGYDAGFFNWTDSTTAANVTIDVRSCTVRQSGSMLTLWSISFVETLLRVSVVNITITADSVDATTLLSIANSAVTDCSVWVEQLHITVRIDAKALNFWKSPLFKLSNVDPLRIQFTLVNSNIQLHPNSFLNTDNVLVLDVTSDYGSKHNSALGKATMAWNNVSIAVSSATSFYSQFVTLVRTNASLSHLSWTMRGCTVVFESFAPSIDEMSLWFVAVGDSNHTSQQTLALQKSTFRNVSSIFSFRGVAHPIRSVHLDVECNNTWCLVPSNTTAVSRCITSLTIAELQQEPHIIATTWTQDLTLVTDTCRDDPLLRTVTASVFAKHQVSTGSSTSSQQVSSRTVTLSSSNIHSRSLRELQTASFAGTPSLNSLTLPSTHARALSNTITLPLPPPPPPPSAPVALQAVTMVVIGPLSGAFLAAPVAGLVQRSALAVRFSLCSSPSSSTAAAVASDDDDDASSPMNSPTQMKIGSSPGSAKRGAVIGNIVLLGALALLVAVFGLVRRRARGSVQAATAQIGCPGRLYIAYALLLQPTVTASVALLTTGSAGNVVLGLFGLVAMLAVVGYAVYAVHVGCRDLVRGVPNPSNGSILDTLAGRRILWKSTSRTPDDPQDRGRLFSSQYDTLIGKYIPGRTVFFATGALWSVLTGCTGALSPSSTSQCHAAQWMLLAISLLSLGSLVALRPFASRLDFAVNLALEALSAVSSVLSLTSVDGGSQSVSYTQIGLIGLLSAVRVLSRVWMIVMSLTLTLSSKSSKNISRRKVRSRTSHESEQRSTKPSNNDVSFSNATTLEESLQSSRASANEDESSQQLLASLRQQVIVSNSSNTVSRVLESLSFTHSSVVDRERFVNEAENSRLLAALLEDAETVYDSRRRSMRRLQAVINIICVVSRAKHHSLASIVEAYDM